MAGGAVAAAGVAGFGVKELFFGEDPPPMTHPTGVQTRWPIKHVVYVMLENRSFNHMFAAFPGATDVTKVGVTDGKESPLIVATEWFPGDLPHDRSSAVHDVNHGKMDGFAMYPEGDVPALEYAMSFHERDTIANWWHWAENFVLCDHVFASANSASYPNHLYMIAGTSGGAFDNPIQSPEVLDVRRDKGLAKTWGCDAPDGAVVNIYDYEEGDKGGKGEPVSKMPPCFTFDTQGQQLSRKKIDWAFYAANETQTGYIWSAYTAIDGVYNTDLFEDHVHDVDDLIPDIEAGALPSVTWVTPKYEFSDHPPYSTIWAQNWATSVINAIMKSPMWNSTAIFVTWDEWGGTYDPVKPPKVDALGLGVRVPMLVISPWANRGMIDHEVGEFSSPHKFIADNFGLQHLSDRVRQTHNFEHVFDFRRPKARLLAPDPLPLLQPGPLPDQMPKDYVGDWPPKYSLPQS